MKKKFVWCVQSLHINMKTELNIKTSSISYTDTDFNLTVYLIHIFLYLTYFDISLDIYIHFLYVYTNHFMYDVVWKQNVL